MDIVNGGTWLLLTGTVLPPVISLINRSRWSSAVKSVVALLVCTVAAVAVAWKEGITGGKDIASAIIIVITVTKALYEAVWKPTGISPAIEEATG